MWKSAAKSKKIDVENHPSKETYQHRVPQVLLFVNVTAMANRQSKNH